MRNGLLMALLGAFLLARTVHRGADDPRTGRGYTLIDEIDGQRGKDLADVAKKQAGAAAAPAANTNSGLISRDIPHALQTFGTPLASRNHPSRRRR